MTKVRIRKPREIGEVMKAVRESRGIRQEDLANDLAFSRDYLIDLEAGKGSIYITRLFRALDALGITVTLDYELDDDDA